MLTGFYLFAMLLVPYPFASILSIVFPFPQGFFRICTLLLVTYCFAHFALQTSGFSAMFFPRSPLKFLYAYVCHIMLCTLRLTNIGIVQCFHHGILHACVFMFCVLCLANTGFVNKINKINKSFYLSVEGSSTQVVIGDTFQI